MPKTSEFDYFLPEELIAQEPLKKRDSSRLLKVGREDATIGHHRFNDLPDLLQPGDRLVFNNTRVIPANLVCIKDTGARIALLFTHRVDEQTWQVIAKPAKRLKVGRTIAVEANRNILLEVVSHNEDGSRTLRLKEGVFDSIDSVIEAYGSMPLPPYIRREADPHDKETYQTIYAQHNGAIAAPTAGLHFTSELMKQLEDRQISSTFITLHVGIGTFRPVKEEDPSNHLMHEEFYQVSAKAVDEIRETKNAGGRVIAVGTTTVRTLEHCASMEQGLTAHKGSTKMFILPGYTFKIIDGLITNFHLPRSTLLMLVSAFANRELVLKAYNEAVAKQYRFFSYGDAMFLI